MVTEVNSKVGQHNIFDLEKITVNLVKKALKLMKDGKNDAIFDFQSDCLTCGSEDLVIHLTNLLRSFVSHGSVPYFILVCTLLPLVKDNLADGCLCSLNANISLWFTFEAQELDSTKYSTCYITML